MSQFNNEAGGTNLPQPDLTTCETIKCKECGSKLFEEKVFLKLIPGLLIGETTRKIMPLNIIQCSKCGYIPFEYIDPSGELEKIFNGTEK